MTKVRRRRRSATRLRVMCKFLGFRVSGFEFMVRRSSGPSVGVSSGVSHVVKHLDLKPGPKP